MAGSASPLGLGLGKPVLTRKLKPYGHKDVRAGAKATARTSTRTPTQRISAPHVLSVELCLAKYGSSRTAGLSDAEAAARLATWGRNALLEKRAKSTFRLILEQFQDRLVQILLGVAVLSAVLAVFEQQGMDMMTSVSWSPEAFVEPLVILSILVINAVVGAVQGRSAESSLAALKQLQPSTAHVLREGQWRGECPASELVPGDVILLRVGDKVPADARLVELKTTTFSTDESSLTGEGLMVQKDLAVSTTDPAAIVSAKENMVFSGTVVCNGVAVAVVTGTGQGTEIGKINAGVLAAQDDAHGGSKKTPLAESLEVFGNQLSVMVACICVAVFAANVPRFGDSMFASKAEGAVHYAKIAVALGVAAIPEGLPAVVTLCLSLGTARMAKRNVIVRKLSSVETLGCASVICTDKTGTLTTNQMVVRSLVTLEGRGVVAGTEGGGMIIKERRVEGSSYAPVGAVEGLPKGCVGREACAGLRDLALTASLCNEASIEVRNGSYARTGEPTEAALKVLVEKLGTGEEGEHEHEHEHEHERAHGHGEGGAIVDPQRCSKFWETQYHKLATLEFNRDRKSMSVLCRRAATNSGGSDGSIDSAEKGNRLFVKGAAEMVLSRCTHVQTSSGEVAPLTAELRARLEAQFADMAARPLRVLALAYRQVPESEELGALVSADDAGASAALKDQGKFEAHESGLTLVALTGIKDPARPEARAAIDKCRQAGIRVMMMTGDSKETAVSIARDVGIFHAHQSEAEVAAAAFTGKEFFALPERQQMDLLRRERGNQVFCRTEPADKQRLISMLERLDEVVAMTGDGVNDAPALQQVACSSSIYHICLETLP